jgi:hypothetical protein
MGYKYGRFVENYERKSRVLDYLYLIKKSIRQVFFAMLNFLGRNKNQNSVFKELIKKIFVKVPHKRLILKQERYGIHDKLLN